MSEFDVVVRGGTVVDGTGLPRYKADVAVKEGRIVQIRGNIHAAGAKEIDASGCIVAPGAIDLHTHYDAQLTWDPYATWAPYFGATSLLIGNCGFGFAPTRPEDRELNMRMMDRIESIPYAAMQKGMRWDWETFPQFLDSLERHKLGLNVGSSLPFSPLRAYVLGMRPARERTSVTDKELNQMKAILYEAMKAGAFGFSSDKQEEDKAEDGSHLPSHVASDREYIGLAEVLGQFPVGLLGWTTGTHVYKNDRRGAEELLLQMMRVSGHKAHIQFGSEVSHPERADVLYRARAEGLPLVGQQNPYIGQSWVDYQLAHWNLWDIYPNWVEPMVGTPAERAVKLRDMKRRDAMKRDLIEMEPNPKFDWTLTSVRQVAHERNRKYEKLTIAELAKKVGKHPLDAMLDLALDENLETFFTVPAGGLLNPEVIAEMLKNRYVHFAFSDGGAHGLFRTRADWPVLILTQFVRDREFMTLEEAHVKISAYPAWLVDYKDRGVIRAGAWADLMIYNLEKLGVQDQVTLVNDLPGGALRRMKSPRACEILW